MSKPKKSKKHEVSLTRLAIQLAVVVGVAIAITLVADQARADGSLWTADAPAGAIVHNPNYRAEHIKGVPAHNGSSITIIGCGIKMPEWYHGDCGNSNGKSAYAS